MATTKKSACVSTTTRRSDGHRYTLRIETLCPKEWEHAHYYWGSEMGCPDGIPGWRKEGDWQGRMVTYNPRRKEVGVLLSAYDGEDERVRPSVDWEFDVPMDGLLASRVGTWLVPTDVKGHFVLCPNKKSAKEAILSLADHVWEKGKQAPGVEVIRLDGWEREEGWEPFPILRSYQFWFPTPGRDPYADADLIEEASSTEYCYYVEEELDDDEEGWGSLREYILEHSY